MEWRGEEWTRVERSRGSRENERGGVERSGEGWKWKNEWPGKYNLLCTPTTFLGRFSFSSGAAPEHAISKLKPRRR